jgi:hypothetical protein
VLLYSDWVRRRRGAAPGDGVVHCADDESAAASEASEACPLCPPCPPCPEGSPGAIEGDDCPELPVAPSEDSLGPPPMLPTHAAPTRTGMSRRGARPIRCFMRLGRVARAIASFVPESTISTRPRLPSMCAHSGEPACAEVPSDTLSPIFYEGRQRRCGARDNQTVKPDGARVNLGRRAAVRSSEHAANAFRVDRDLVDPELEWFGGRLVFLPTNPHVGEFRQ